MQLVYKRILLLSLVLEGKIAFSPSSRWQFRKRTSKTPSSLFLAPQRRGGGGGGFESQKSSTSSTTKTKKSSTRKQKNSQSVKSKALSSWKTSSSFASSSSSSIVHRRDYQPPNYRISHAFLDVNIVDNDNVVITSTLTVVSPSSSSSSSSSWSCDLILDGDARFWHLKQVAIVSENGRDILQVLVQGMDYIVTDDTLVIKAKTLATRSNDKNDAAPSLLRVQSIVHHSAFDIDDRGKELSGLYRRNGMFFTHCEPTGFRQISYFIDRPDHTARFRVRMEASKSEYPLLLSIGNCIQRGGTKDNDRHYVLFDDPFPMPSYVFALVAAGPSLSSVHDTYTTRTSGRHVDLNIYSDAPRMERMQFALSTLKESLQWDEETYGLEYDLNAYNIVAVQHFSLGAMENRGLNLFQTSLIATDPACTTDVTYDLVQKTIAHEVFHNWSGNRVTIRDWFEFGLKEGLTVYRDQEFTADVGLCAVTRIEAVKILREKQFREDAGENRHAVRPESAHLSREHTLDELASSTTYHKGAEVCRMFKSILGKDGFCKGLKLYVERHDGTGATWDDFRKAMADANGVNLDQFALWYSTAGTPTVSYKFLYDNDRKAAFITFTQSMECNPKVLLHIPISVGFLDKITGDEVVATKTVELKERTETFEFPGLDNEVVPSILRDFSAPVILVPEDQARHDEILSFLATYDTDGFNRWEAIHKLYSICIFKIMRDEDIEHAKRSVFEAFGHTLRNPDIDPATKSAMLSLPTESVLSRQLETENPRGVHTARQELGRLIHAVFKSEMRDMYDELWASIPPGRIRTDSRSRSVRALRNTLLDFLCFVVTEEEQTVAASVALQHFDKASGLTDKLSAFRKLSSMSGATADARNEATAKFYEYAKQTADPVVMHKWFQTQALSDLPGVLERVQNLTQHPDFKATNAGRFRSLITSFAMNSRAFHCKESYNFIGSVISQMDRVAPQLSVELANKFSTWRRHEPELSALMRAELRRIGSSKPISQSLALTVQRILGNGN